MQNIEKASPAGNLPQEEFIQKEVEKKVSEYQQDYYNKQQALFGVVNRVREFPLDITPPKDPKSLYRVDYPEDGGVYSRIQGFVLPYRGFPYQDSVLDLDKCKKIGKTFTLVMIERIRKMSKIKAILLLLFAEDLAKAWLQSFHAILKPQRFKESMHCQPVREVWRVLNDRIGKSKLYEDYLFGEIRRDLICNGLENDNAYKYRFQNLVCEVNKDNLRKNPLKELNRIIDIAISRELPKGAETQPRFHWKKLKSVINILFRLKKSYLYWVRDFILDLNFDEIKLNEYDICFCEPRKDYDFEYKDKPEYREWLKIKQNAKKEELKKLKENESKNIQSVK